MDRHAFQIATQRRSHYPTHGQCRPRRRVDLVTMVRLDNLHVVVRPQRTRSLIQQRNALFCATLNFSPFEVRVHRQLAISSRTVDVEFKNLTRKGCI